MKTKADFFEMGKQHAINGKQCTPYDCQEIDKIILEQSRKSENRTKYYSQMRGAFNKGWESKYFEIVSNAN